MSLVSPDAHLIFLSLIKDTQATVMEAQQRHVPSFLLSIDCRRPGFSPKKHAPDALLSIGAPNADIARRPSQVNLAAPLIPCSKQSGGRTSASVINDSEDRSGLDFWCQGVLVDSDDAVIRHCQERVWLIALVQEEGLPVTATICDFDAGPLGSVDHVP